MPLVPVPPPSFRGNPLKGLPHHCDPATPCIIHLSDIGKKFHSFPKRTFCVCYTPPPIPCPYLRHFASHPYTWSWTTKGGPNQGKTFSIATIPIVCNKDASKAIRWIVSLFHSFKTHLNPFVLDLETGRVFPAIVKIYQSNMLLHFCSQSHTIPAPS